MKHMFLTAMACFFVLVLIANVSYEKKENNNLKFLQNNQGIPIETFDSASNITTIYFRKVPERVAVFEYNNIESMLALGLADKIVITDLNADSRYGKYLAETYPEEMSKVTDNRLMSANMESVIYANPDFILGWRSLFGRAYLGSTFWWQARGINAYIVATSNHTVPEGSIEEELKYMDDMGKIFDCTTKTDVKIKEIKDFLDRIKVALKGKEDVSVLVLEGGAGRLINYDSKWLVGDLVKESGGKIMSDVKGISIEDILQIDPEVILVVHFNNSTYGLLNEFKNDPKYNSLRAVRENRIYPVTLDRMYATGFKTIDSLKIIFSALHPEIAL